MAPPPPPSRKAPKTTEKIAAPYAPGSARPPPRDPSELFFSEPEPDSTPRARARDSIISPRAGADRHYQPVRVFGGGDGDGDEPSESPIKPKLGSNKGFQAVRVFDQDDGPDEATPQHARAGASKNFHAIRVFEQDGVDAEPAALRYKTHPNKFGHFELGDEANASREVHDLPSVRSRPIPDWNFDDYNTPEKPRRKLRAQDERHFGWSDNEDEAIETPAPRPRVVQPRRDARTHLSLADNALTSDAEDAPVPQKRMISSFHNKGLGLYDNNLYDEEGTPTPLDQDSENDTTTTNGGGAKKQPLGVVANDAYRKKDFDAHWEVHDPSVEERQQQAREKAENLRPASSDRAKSVQSMAMPSWDAYDTSPGAKSAPPPPAVAAAATTTTTSLPKRASRAMFKPSWGPE
jgi:hypothetical protein